MKSMNFNNSIDKYDPISGYYFKSISKEVEASRFSKSNDVKTTNIGVLDPQTNKITTIFPASEDLKIGQVIFEIGYDKTLSAIKFNDNSYFIRNNNGIEKRKVNNSLLITTMNENSYTLWKAEKNGTNLKKLAVVSEKSNWHIDVKNSLVRIISSEEGTLIIENYDW